MSTSSKSKTKKKAAPFVHNLLWFEIPADDLTRAKSFYSKLFGWKINKMPGGTDYWHIDTAGGNDTPDGGMMKRQNAQHGPTNYINVPSLEKFMAKVVKLGGKICMSKTAVPTMGYFAVCLDTENNPFAIWEKNANAK